MKDKLIPVSFFTLLILLFTSMCFSEETAAPEICFEEKVFDAKEIKGGDYLEHSFKFYNKGKGVLEISAVQTG